MPRLRALRERRHTLSGLRLRALWERRHTLSGLRLWALHRRERKADRSRARLGSLEGCQSRGCTRLCSLRSPCREPGNSTGWLHHSLCIERCVARIRSRLRL